MNRTRWLWGVVLVFSLAWLGIWIFSGWDTVTLEYENKPLGRVLDSFTRQTKLPIFTDLDRTRPVTIRVRRVTVTEALDALQASSESRGGRLVFLLAPDNSGLDRLRGLLPRPAEDAGVLTLEFRIPFPALATIEELPEWRDPRNQAWKPDPGLTRQLLPAAEHAAQATEIRILLPAGWNPPLSKAPPEGKISSSLAALAQRAGAKFAMMYVLPAPRSDGERGRDSSGGGWGGRERGLGRTPSLPPEKWIERLGPRLAALPKEEAAAARASIEATQRQFQDWESLTPEQRREKFQATMQDPASAERMGDRFSRGMRRLSPEQRAQRYKGYVERRAQAKSGQNP